MNSERKKLESILGGSLDDSVYARLGSYVEYARMSGVTWGHQNACRALDSGIDPREYTEEGVRFVGSAELLSE